MLDSLGKMGEKKEKDVILEIAQVYRRKKQGKGLSLKIDIELQVLVFLSKDIQEQNKPKTCYLLL
jgi:hypothetical protein